MIKLLFPGAYAESPFTIDYEKLYAMGYRGILFDIDNTLVPHGAPPTPESDALLRYIQSLGFRTLMISNNNAARIERFLANVDSLYICEADKPEPEGYLRGVELLGCRKEEAIVIGDQVFTDILGANRSGLDSILVKFIGFYKEKKLGVRRRVEKLVLFLYEHSRARNRLGSIEKEQAEETIRNVLE